MQKKPELLRKLEQTKINDRKTIPRFLKLLGKIRSVGDYEEYKKQIFISLVEWSYTVLVIRPIVILAAILLCLSAANFFFVSPPQLFFLAEGLSILWYLLIELKQDLWRKTK
jgi:hypothetical protein